MSPEERNEDDNDGDEDNDECVKNDLVNADKEEDQIPDNLEFDDADVEDQGEVGKFCFDCTLLSYSFYHFNSLTFHYLQFDSFTSFLSSLLSNQGNTVVDVPHFLTYTYENSRTLSISFQT